MKHTPDAEYDWESITV